MLRQIGTLLFLSFLATQAYGQRGLEIAVMRTQVLELDQYYIDGEFKPAASDGDRLVKIQVELRNRSSNLLKVDLSQLEVEVAGETYLPQYVLSDAFESAPFSSVGSLESTTRKLIYSIPGAFLAKDVQLVTHVTTYEFDPFTAAHVYFSEKWEQLPSKAGATYYRRSAGAGKSWIVRNYFVNNDQLQMEAEASQVFLFKKHGLTTWYHENGAVQEQGFFINDKKSGTFLQFHSNGQRRGQITHTTDGTLYDQFWNEAGEALLQNGTGVVNEENSRGNRTVAHYANHTITRSFEVRGAAGDTLYSKADKVPEYKRGINFLYQFLAVNIKYPKEARKNGIEGQVLVGFVVDEKGGVSEVKTLRGIGHGCDEEAERVLGEASNWLPGEVDGAPVKSFVVLPVVFKLS